jgi:hypothetical protein
VSEITDEHMLEMLGVFEYDVHPVRGFPGSALPA